MSTHTTTLIPRWKRAHSRQLQQAKRTTTVASVFDRLDARRPPPEVKNEQPRRNAELRAFLLDILADGPVRTTLVLERGIARKFTRKQILQTRERMKVVIAIKETGKRHGR